MQKKPFYITTTSSYVNAAPHIGFALELVQADTISRFKKLMDQEVAFGYGTDEHGLKIYKKALEAHLDPQAYCNEQVKKFIGLKNLLNLDSNHFMRSTDPHHMKAAQEFWRRCDSRGDIYQKNYKIKYCYGCELEKTDSELVNGACPLHPNLKIEIYEEENYFFRFSRYQKRLLKFYEDNPHFVQPTYRLKEISTFVQKGLQDFSISRLKTKMPWGVDVPGDPQHVMYVWFDALVYYISTLGWPHKSSEYEKFWPGVQVAGKDNLRQQTAIWQAMLMSAGLPNTRQIFIHGFITSEGKKISKSLGNVIDPYDLVKKYGTDAVRYYLLREIPAFEDGDFSYARMHELYNADLANGLGNLVSRVTKLAEDNDVTLSDQLFESIPLPKSLVTSGFNTHIDNFEFNLALDAIWKDLKEIDVHINNDKPWKLNKVDASPLIKNYLKEIRGRVKYLAPFLPETCHKIMSKTQGKVKKISSLFPRLLK